MNVLWKNSMLQNLSALGTLISSQSGIMVASTVHVNMVTYGDLINVLIQCRVIQF